MNTAKIYTRPSYCSAFIQSCVLVACLLTGLTAMAQQTDNPYRTRYPAFAGRPHWTDSLPWSRVTLVSTFGALPDDGLDDSTAVAQGIAALSAQGGGVLYFAPGQYDFSGGIRIKPGVILRGPAPAPGLTNKQAGWAPAAKLVFPQYVFDTLANGGRGTANNTAFKAIASEDSCSNAGLVYLDINRAEVQFRMPTATIPGFSTPQPVLYNRNIIVMGLRTNNAARPDPGVPAANQRPWQRLCFRFVYNISVSAWANVVVANNRLNDAPTDNFLQDGYLVLQRGSTNMKRLTAADRPYFDYTAHYGISVNRGKAAVTYATPETEPFFFRPGIEIRDNWVYKTSRVAIIASGLGLNIIGNIMRDDSTKLSYDIPWEATGKVTPLGANTFENRGIDFSGWSAKVDSNDVIAYRNKVGGYQSTDGEGILTQECCGGTSANDYQIQGNTTRNYIGLFKMRDMNNIRIVGNRWVGGLSNAIGTDIYVNANTNGAAFYLNAAVVEDNIGFRSITMTGSLGGEGNRISGNIGAVSTNLPTFKINCNTAVGNNPGYAAPVYIAIDPADPSPNRPTVPDPCLASGGVVPLIYLETPARDSLYQYCPGQTPIPLAIVGRLRSGNPDSAVADLLDGTRIIAQGLRFNPFDSTVRTSTSLTGGDYAFSFQTRSEGVVARSEVRLFTQDICQGLARPRQALILTAWPLPTRAGAQVHIQGLPATSCQVQIFDGTGRQLFADQPISQDGTLRLPALAKGLILLRITSPQGPGIIRLMVE